MPSTFGQWLIVILALVAGVAGGWVWRGRQAAATTGTSQPIVEGDPVVGLSEDEKAAAAATAVVDPPRPEATVDEAPAPAAVVDEVVPAEVDAAPVATDTLPTGDGTDRAPATVASTDVDTADADRPAAGTERDADTPAADADRDVEPVGPAGAADPQVTSVTAEHADEPTHADLPGDADDERADRVTSATDAGITQRPAVADSPGGDDAGAQVEAGPSTTEPAPTATPVDAVATDEDTTPVGTGAPVGIAAPDTTEEAAEPVTATSGVPAPRTPVEDTMTGGATEAAAPTPAEESDLTVGSALVAAAAPVTPAPVDDTAPADDFRRIQGVGPKMAAALHAAGIRTYRQLAELDEPALRETIRAAGLRAAASLATWPQQAKVLAGAGAEAERVLPVGTGAGEQD